MFDRILVVCVGNICRSPTAEFMLQELLPAKQLESAGLHALAGQDMDPQARAVAENAGIACPAHTARQLTNAMVNQADLILVMEQRHRDELNRRFPQGSGKTMLLGKWQNDKDIADPYRKSDEVFAQIFKQLQENCQAWAKKL